MMHSIRGFSGTLSKFCTIHYGFFEFLEHYFKEHLLMAAFIRFRSTCFSEHLQVDALFIKQLSHFFLGIFLFKESPRKHVPSFSLPWVEGIPSFLFILFSSLLFTPPLFKNFSLLAKHKVLISFKRHFQR